MKRVGLLTIHNTVNYGSLLQTYSTYKALFELGYDVKLIDYRCDKIEKREAVPNFGDDKSIKGLIRHVLWHKDLQKKKDSFEAFINENMSTTETYTRNNIVNVNSEFETFIVGSDIVWGTNITGKDMTYFLDFASPEKKKFSFSSSIGTKWNENEGREICDLLKRFIKISVREQLAADWINEQAGIRVSVTCDPTMLWNRQYWERFQDRSVVPSEEYILIYLVNPDNKNIIDGIKYGKEHNCRVYFINFFRHIPGTISIRPDSIQKWIALIANAKAVFTASYHGLLFSLYFHRNVFYYNRGEKSRMHSLCDELKITFREGTDDNVSMDLPIDYGYVDKIIEGKRTVSWEYLEGLF